MNSFNFFKNKVRYIIVAIFLYACTYNKAELLNNQNSYPSNVESIVVNKCANAGCHSQASMQGAGGLDLTHWDKMFNGSRGGAVVIPYRSDFSTLCYYTNVDTSEGIVLQPTMPLNSTPLSKSEYITLRDWINNGAPNKKGFVKFSDFSQKDKLYICNRGCDVVTVMDPVTGLAMRYIDVGNTSNIEGPFMVKVSPDKMYWYVLFSQGNCIQKFRTSDNAKVGELIIGNGIWSSLFITNNSKHAFVADADIAGSILYLDLDLMQVITTYNSGLIKPSGLCVNKSSTILYATALDGNFIYKFDISNPLLPIKKEICLEANMPISTTPSLNPHSIVLSSDETKYYVTCTKSSELKILNVNNDSVINSLPTSSNPSDMSISTQALFISCAGVSGTTKKSAINVFDFGTNNILPEVYAGHDSKGIMVHEPTNKLFVVNRNVSLGGPAAHHEPVCDGKNGYMSAIDLTSLKIIPEFKIELSVDPYYIGK